MRKTKWKKMAACVLTGLTVAFSGCSLLPKEEDVISPPLVEPERLHIQHNRLHAAPFPAGSILPVILSPPLNTRSPLKKEEAI